jgi:radical SAM protein with 4Fe4S-binding SPASM domain
MADIDLFKKRLAYTRKELPNVRLVTNTNGDYLSNKNLDGLQVDELSIMDYDNKGMDYAAKRLKDLRVDITKVTGNKVYGRRWHMDIMYYVNWPKEAMVNDRGGILKKHSSIRRNKNCYEPNYFAGIDYNGNVMPCCNMRSDNERHKPYILGNIKDNTLREIYEKETTAKLRSQVPHLIPCHYCTKDGGRYTRDNPGIEYD